MSSILTDAAPCCVHRALKNSACSDFCSSSGCKKSIASSSQEQEGIPSTVPVSHRILKHVDSIKLECLTTVPFTSECEGCLSYISFPVTILMIPIPAIFICNLFTTHHAVQVDDQTISFSISEEEMKERKSKAVKTWLVGSNGTLFCDSAAMHSTF
jgi:hypothetical protein